MQEQILVAVAVKRDAREDPHAGRSYRRSGRSCGCTTSGRALSGTLTRGFEQLDAKIAMLALALEQFEASHPIDKTKHAEGQKASAKLVAEEM